ncbi:MAG TPA: succinate dehydrogenase assembly factor 2 [Kiloniellales bacterium]
MPNISARRESLEHRRKRLRYRCAHRGTKELDLLLGSFAERHLDGFDGAQLRRLEALLEVPEPLIHAWLVAGVPPSPGYESDVLRLLLAHRLNVQVG